MTAIAPRYVKRTGLCGAFPSIPASSRTMCMHNYMCVYRTVRYLPVCLSMYLHYARLLISDLEVYYYFYHGERERKDGNLIFSLFLHINSAMGMGLKFCFDFLACMGREQMRYDMIACQRKERNLHETCLVTGGVRTWVGRSVIVNRKSVIEWFAHCLSWALHVPNSSSMPTSSVE